MIQRFNQPIWWVVVGAIAVGLVMAGVLMVLRPQPPISADIQKQLSFALIYPAASIGYVIDQSTVTYNGQAKALTFTAAGSSNRLVFSEQATPETFSDIPDYYQKLTEKLHDYEDFDSTVGHVALTRPDELHGGQSAVMNGSGTLMFVHPNRDLSADAWRKLFNNLQVSK
ncbi:MAG TPA: hypothetical protein VLI05_00895 [Candidatus Saccharimonadia bacterium]|nr:hypothetical protein [Candidatus Saccharimonadia bacterium]